MSLVLCFTRFNRHWSMSVHRVSWHRIQFSLENPPSRPAFLCQLTRWTDILDKGTIEIIARLQLFKEIGQIITELCYICGELQNRLFITVLTVIVVGLVTSASTQIRVLVLWTNIFIFESLTIFGLGDWSCNCLKMSRQRIRLSNTPCILKKTNAIRGGP